MFRKCQKYFYLSTVGLEGECKIYNHLRSLKAAPATSQITGKFLLGISVLREIVFFLRTKGNTGLPRK